MTKEIVKCTMTVIQETTGTTVAQYTTYGTMIDKATIITPEYTFHSHRNAGFGKSTTLHRDGNTVKVKIEAA